MNIFNLAISCGYVSKGPITTRLTSGLSSAGFVTIAQSNLLSNTAYRLREDDVSRLCYLVLIQDGSNALPLHGYSFIVERTTRFVKDIKWRITDSLSVTSPSNL